MKLAVVGSGLVGAVAALALAQIGIEVIWIGEPKRESSDRMLALNSASIAFLSDLGVLKDLPESVRGMVKEMRISDFDYEPALVFNAAKNNVFELCEIVPAATLLDCIEIHIQKNEKIIAIHQSYISHQYESETVILHLKNTDMIKVDYVIAADGAMSLIREKEGIACEHFDYERAAVTATLQLKQAHQKIAYQYFLAHGPLALLPLSASNDISIVWSTTLAEANQLKHLSAEAFIAKLVSILPVKFKEAQLKSAQHVFPLRSLIANTITKNKIILVGDAAHVMHPLAGLGLNIGILDVIALQQFYLDIKNKKILLGPITLQRFARERKWETGLYLKTIHAIERAFHEPTGVARKIGQLALLAGSIPLINKALVNQAVNT